MSLPFEWPGVFAVVCNQPASIFVLLLSLLVLPALTPVLGSALLIDRDTATHLKYRRSWHIGQTRKESTLA